MANNLYNSKFLIAETTANYRMLKEKYNNDSNTKTKLYGTLLVARRENDVTSKDLLLCSDNIYNLSQPSINVQVPLQYEKSDMYNNKKILSIKYNQDQFNNSFKSELTLNDDYIRKIIENTITDLDINNNIEAINKTIEDIKTTLNNLSARITALENKENIDNNEGTDNNESTDNNEGTENEIVEETNIEE